MTLQDALAELEPEQRKIGDFRLGFIDGWNAWGTLSFWVVVPRLHTLYERGYLLGAATALRNEIENSQEKSSDHPA